MNEIQKLHPVARSIVMIFPFIRGMGGLPEETRDMLVQALDQLEPGDRAWAQASLAHVEWYVLKNGDRALAADLSSFGADAREAA